MKAITFFGIFSTIFFSSLNVKAQIPLTSIVEHFTNTSCSVCASNNPNIHTIINAFPNTLHISFHPSSPYSNDVFSQQNMIENDSRTQFYGLYGSTPKVAVNGSVIPLSNLASTLGLAASLTSNFEINMEQLQVASNLFNVNVKIKKVAADSISNALLFIGVIEDTVFQTTNNGESEHYHVFRKSISGITGDSVLLPTNVGDSVNFNFEFSGSSFWNLNRIQTIGILQKTTNELINSAITLSTDFVADLQDNQLPDELQVLFYPNPVSSNRIWFEDDLEEVIIYDQTGELLIQTTSILKEEGISIATLSPGIYQVKTRNAKGISTSKLIKF